MVLQRQGIQPVIGPGRNPLYDKLATSSPTAIGSLFRTIDTPARILREGITGKKNATGTDLRKLLGLDLGSVGNTVTDLGLEIGFDPLNLLTFGTGAAGKVARAARAANILDDAPRAFSRLMIDKGTDLGKLSDSPSWTNLFGENAIGQRAADVFKRTGITNKNGDVAFNKLTDDDLFARPLVGRRESMTRSLPGTNRQMSLRDLVNAQGDNSAQALSDIQNFARRNNTTADQLLDRRLFNDAGIKLPLGDTIMEFNLPGKYSESLGRALDNVGNTIRYSPVGRKATQLFDNSVRGAFDDTEQLIGKRFSRSDEVAGKLAAGKVSRFLSSVDSDLVDLVRKGNNGRVFRSLVEDNYDLLDDAIKNSSEVKDLMDVSRATQRDDLVGKTREFFKDYLDESRDAGLKSNAFGDQFGNQYMPRVLDRDLYPDRSKAFGGGGGATSAVTGDMQARGKEFNVPGGTNTLTQLTEDKSIVGSLFDKSKDDATVASEVYQFIQGKQNQLDSLGRLPKGVKYKKKDARKLTQKLRGMDETALTDGKRLFNQNPFELIDRYATGRQRAMGRADQLQTLIAQTAQTGKRGGTGFQSVNKAISNLGMKTNDLRKTIGPLPPGVERYSGAGANVIDKLDSFGIQVDPETLKRMSIDSDLRDRISNISNFYDNKKVTTDFGKFVGGITRNFKQWVLALPRRYARDWYSGAFSNFITNPNAGDMYYGYDVTKDIMQQNWNVAARKLSQLPRYEGMSADDIITTVQREMAEVNMSQTGRLQDVGYENVQLAQDSGRDFFAKYRGGDGDPVTTPMYSAYDTITGNNDAPSLFSEAYSGSELFTKKGYFEDILPRVNGSNRTVKNPLLRASARSAETTDEINRLGGYFSLLHGGYNPEAAARMTTAAQIDYSSLTPFEREWISGFLFPFWSYLSRVSVWGSKAMLKDMTYFNTAIRAPMVLGGGRGNEYMPTRIEEKYGIPFNETFMKLAGPILNQDLEGSTYLADIDIPFVDSILMIDPAFSPDTGQLAIGDTLQGTAQSIMGQTNPLLKYGFEQISGRDLYTKTPLDSTRRTLPTLLRRGGMTDAGSQALVGALEPLITNTLPILNHPLSIARRLSKEGTTPLQGGAQALLNATTGVRVETVTPEEELRDIRERIGKFMENSPYSREMNVRYIPEDQKEFASPELLQMFDLDKQLQQQQRGLRERRLRGNPLLTY